MLNKVWKHGQPNFDLGENLGADLVAMYQFDITDAEDETKVYLFNVRDRIEYSQSVYTEDSFTLGDGYIEGLEVTRKIFSDSIKDMR